MQKNTLRTVLQISAVVFTVMLSGCSMCGVSTAKVKPAYFPQSVSFLDGTTVSSITILSANSGWATGRVYILGQANAQNIVDTVPKAGAILHFNGTSWNSIKVNNPLFSLAMANANSGWAVGANGTILYYNGSAWTPQNSGVSGILWGVSAVSATEAWAVGDNGVILHCLNGIWKTAVSPTTAQLRAVYMQNADSGWAAGANGTVLQYTKGVWKLVTVPASFTMNTIAVVPPDTLLFGGGDLLNRREFSVNSPAALKYQSGKWSVLSGFMSPVPAFAVVSASDIWEFGDLGPSHFNGQGWILNMNQTQLYDGTASDAYNGIIYYGTSEGSIFSYNGSKITELFQAQQCNMMVLFNC